MKVQRADCAHRSTFNQFAFKGGLVTSHLLCLIMTHLNQRIFKVGRQMIQVGLPLVAPVNRIYKCCYFVEYFYSLHTFSLITPSACESAKGRLCAQIDIQSKFAFKGGLVTSHLLCLIMTRLNQRIFKVGRQTIQVGLPLVAPVNRIYKCCYFVEYFYSLHTCSLITPSACESAKGRLCAQIDIQSKFAFKGGRVTSHLLCLIMTRLNQRIFKVGRQMIQVGLPLVAPVNRIYKCCYFVEYFYSLHTCSLITPSACESAKGRLCAQIDIQSVCI